MNDKEVILKIKIGQIDYFSYLVKKYTSLIYRYIKVKLFKKEDVDDLVQNTFISFYKAISRFDESRPVMPYLYQIAQNEMKMYFRSKKQTIVLDDRLKLVDEDSVLSKTIMIDIERATRELPKEQKKALQLLADGYSYQEVAYQLKKPLNTVRSLIRRARLKLAKKNEKS